MQVIRTCFLFLFLVVSVIAVLVWQQLLVFRLEKNGVAKKNTV